LAQRLFDLTALTATAALWLPALLALLVFKRCIDGGPVVFHQARVGRGGDLFVMYKIRTTLPAYHSAPDDWSNDVVPPRTRLGVWLRRHGLDELPQVWNVLKGEMSLVGPRPETPYHFRRFALALPGYARRLAVRPGITGLAQVRGLRGDTSIDQRLRADIEYIARRSLRLDATIALRTIWIALRG